MDEIERLAAEVGAALQQHAIMLACAESCTGGWVSTALTAIAGSSAWFDRGFVTYSNAAKMEMLGVTAASLREAGAVSEQTVREMAAGALARSRAQIALAISGVAGPGGGSADKPVGTVCFAWQRRHGAGVSITHHLSGDRRAVREQSVLIALRGVLDLLNA